MSSGEDITEHQDSNLRLHGSRSLPLGEMFWWSARWVLAVIQGKENSVWSFTEFSLYYNILNRDMCDIRDKFYFSFMNLSNSFFIPFSVVFRPIFWATCCQVSSSNILYFMILCILGGIVFNHSSTFVFNFSACILLSSSTFCW